MMGAALFSVDPRQRWTGNLCGSYYLKLMVNTLELTPSTVDAAHTLQDVLARFKGDKSAAARVIWGLTAPLCGVVLKLVPKTSG